MSAVPVGGTTGHSHEHSEAVTVAAEWLRGIPSLQRPRPIIPVLRERFGLTALEAVEAIREANGGGA